MSRLLKILLLPVLLAASVAAQGGVEGHGAERRFISEKYRFSMEVPVGWGASIELDTPLYFYAPPSGTFVQAEIPEGGAVISVQVHGTSDSEQSITTTEWALSDARTEAASVPAIVPFQMPKRSGASVPVTSSYDERTYSPDDHTQHSVAVFWKFGGKLFAAHLNYNVNDPKGPQFERTFRQTIRSSRPLPTRPQLNP